MPVSVKICIPIAESLTPHCERSLHALQEDACRDRNCVIGVDILRSCYLYSSRNMLIGESWCIEDAKKAADLWDYYWFIDSDIGGFDLAMLHTMIAARSLAVSVPYIQRDDPGRFVCGLFHWDCEELASMFRPNTVELYPECDWCGLGCGLFHKSLFTSYLTFPWFSPVTVQHTYKGREFAEVIGEDLSFCRKLYFAGIKVKNLALLRHKLEHHR